MGGLVYVVTGMVGAWRVFKGHHFRYPLLGDWIAGWLGLEAGVEG